MASVRRVARHAAGMSLLVMLALSSHGAGAAGLNDRPYTFPGGGPGMSPAAREAILEDKLLGRGSGDIVIGPDGGLLLVRRAGDGAAVLQAPAAPFVLPYAGGARLGVSGFGFGFDGYLGRPRYGALIADYAMSSGAINGWTSMLLGGYVGPGTSSVDAWTSQVAGLAPYAR